MVRAVPFSTRALLALGVGLALLLAPFAAGGFGTQTVYSYERQSLDYGNDETVEHLYELPGVRYGTGDQLRVVREAAADGTLDRRDDAVSSAVRNLTRTGSSPTTSRTATTASEPESRTAGSC